MIIGPFYTEPDKLRFTVWAPFAEKLELNLVSENNRLIPLQKDPLGYWRTVLESPAEKIRYLFKLNEEVERPDPASHFQPDGVHRPSQVVNHRSFPWTDAKWQGIALHDYLIYELHVGTFTPEGTFEAIIGMLPSLKELGVNALEIMPVAQFPGERNWGYDGVYPFAVQNSYGGPGGLKRLVNECHKMGFAVILDVVYNHLGPEGNYLRNFGPYFTSKYKTPWGEAVNFDDAYSDDVRNFFIENALHWFRNYHIDALRLDAIHAITDMSARPFLQELAGKTDQFSVENKRKFHLIAESSLNDARIVKPSERGGFGIQAQWLDDFHHSLRTVLTGENSGYYVDFGRLDQLEKAMRNGFVYEGDYSAFRKRRHGNSSADIAASQFVVFIQNHDQVGNRMFGERLPELVPFAALKLAAAACLLSPYIPLIFMGEEYGETAPFLYFVDHGDANLIEAVRKGRKEEFKDFKWKGEPPDPQDPQTFLRSKLNLSLKDKKHHRVVFSFYRELLRLRKYYPSLKNLSKLSMRTYWDDSRSLLFIHRWKDDDEIFIMLHVCGQESEITFSFPSGQWKKILNSSDVRWDGKGSQLPDLQNGETRNRFSPWEFTLYHKEINE